jgi:hypothetical protein
MLDTTVIIKTIGRKTLKAAVKSARREGFKTIVISDGVNTHGCGAHQYVKLGRKWGMYGGMAANVGAAIAPTEFITFLDDDDQFVEGAGDVIRRSLNTRPEVDIWVAGVRFNTDIILHNTQTGEETYRGRDLAIWPDKGVTEGNVAMPTYRTSIFSRVPFTDTVPQHVAAMTDLLHVKTCEDVGYKVDWFGEALYLVRPHMADAKGMEKINGRGV